MYSCLCALCGEADAGQGRAGQQLAAGGRLLKEAEKLVRQLVAVAHLQQKLPVLAGGVLLQQLRVQKMHVLQRGTNVRIQRNPQPFSR